MSHRKRKNHQEMVIFVGDSQFDRRSSVEITRNKMRLFGE